MTNPAELLVSSIVDYMIEAEYGKKVADELKGARLIARGALMFELDTNDRELADAQVRIRVTAGLAARVCQCGPACRHETAFGDALLTHGRACTGHFEADVPEIDGKKLCGTCYGVTWRAAQ